jgi:hypothetical protein
MINRILAPACLALFALTAGLTSASTASAANYGSFVLHNTSSVAINYTVVWGDGDVESFTIQPGTQTAHFVALDVFGEMPSPTVVFDSNGRGSLITMQSYDLSAYAVNDPMNGKDYSFVYSASGLDLDLYAG